MITKLYGYLNRFYRSIYLKFWFKFHNTSGNVHLSSEKKMKIKIPFYDLEIFSRKTTNDLTRILEFQDSRQYSSSSYLHKKILDINLTTLIDIGANIGTSSLKIVDQFKSIKKVIAIEANYENFNILQSNFKLWSKKYDQISFNSRYGIATYSSELNMSQDKSIADLTKKNSISGTFRFKINKLKTFSENDAKSISINDTIKELGSNQKIFVKIDIEGGEDYLLSKNTDWVKNVSFLVIEIHDKYHQELINSSKNVINLLNENNFAIIPELNLLKCYNRNLFN